MPADPVRGQPELDVLVDRRVRRVVGRDRVGGAVDEGRQARRGVRRRERSGGLTRSAGRTAARPARRRPTDRPRGRRASSASHAQRRAPASHSSVSARWCGVTSQVTGSPAAFARRTRSSDAGRRQVGQVQPRPRLVATTSARIARSRATAASSAAAGQPRRPEHRRDEAVVRLRAVGQRRGPRRGPRPAGRASRRTASALRRTRGRPDRRPVVARTRPRRASASSPSGASVSPARPTDTAPYGSSADRRPARAAAARTRREHAGVVERPASCWASRRPS